MESQTHSIANLFAQLGLPDDALAIDAFIAGHSLPHDIQLFDAPFWSAAQAAFLKTEIAEDADWSPVIDTLDARLRARQ